MRVGHWFSFSSQTEDVLWISYTASTQLFQDSDFQRTEKEALSSDHELEGPGVSISVQTKSIKGCQKPNKVAGSLIYFSGTSDDSLRTALTDEEFEYPHGTEVRFDCLPTWHYNYPDGGEGKKMRRWRIVCKSGVWIGESLHCRDDKKLLASTGTASNQFNSSCRYRAQAEKDNVVTFFGDEQLKDGIVRVIQPGAELIHRCVDIGKYEFEGTPTMDTGTGGRLRRQRCIGGVLEGDGVVRCQGLNQQHGYDLHMPPTILIRYQI